MWEVKLDNVGKRLLEIFILFGIFLIGRFYFRFSFSMENFFFYKYRFISYSLLLSLLL